MNVLGFTDAEKLSLFKTIAGILQFGNIEVKQRPREEWATIPTATIPEKVSVIFQFEWRMLTWKSSRSCACCCFINRYTSTCGFSCTDYIKIECHYCVIC